VLGVTDWVTDGPLWVELQLCTGHEVINTLVGLVSESDGLVKKHRGPVGGETLINNRGCSDGCSTGEGGGSGTPTRRS
jgi:hypothetical protein